MSRGVHLYVRQHAPARAWWRGFSAWTVLAVLAALTGVRPALAQLPNASKHLLAPGDILSVQLFDGATPSSLTVQVDDAGQIVLPLVRAVKVAGMTPRTAGEFLTEQYSTFYLHPTVSVLVQAYGEMEVFVFGPDFVGRIVHLPNGSRLLDLLNTNDLTAGSLQLTALSSPGVPPFVPGSTVPLVASGQPDGTAPPGTPILPPFLASGAYRRLHLVRGGGAFDTLQSTPDHMPPLAQPHNTAGGARPAGIAQSTEVLRAQPPDATSSLEHALNWRRWIADRQSDPASTVWVIDPLQITLEGELSRNNMALQDHDVLYVPAPERFVEVEGVAQPGRYELLGEETLGDVMRLTGSPLYDNDLANAVVQRYDQQGRLNRIILNLYPGLDDMSQVASFKLQNRDRIGIFPLEQRVFVLGEVREGGAFAYVEDSTVLDYIAQAKGETQDAHMAWIAVIRQNRDRLNPGAPAEVFQINFKEIHAGYPSCADFSLLPGDVVYVPPKGKELGVTEILQSVGAVVNGFAVAKSLK